MEEFGIHQGLVAGFMWQSSPAPRTSRREHLLRYRLRPPLAKEHLALMPNHRVRLELKRPFRRARTRQRRRSRVVPPLPELAPTDTAPAPQVHTRSQPTPGRTGARCRYWR